MDHKTQVIYVQKFWLIYSLKDTDCLITEPEYPDKNEFVIQGRCRKSFKAYVTAGFYE